MKIKAVLIDDELGCLKQFIEEVDEQMDDLFLHQISSIDEAIVYLKNPENHVNLVFCDIRLDPDKEREDTGFDLITEVQEHYKQLGKQGLPFGVVFITQHSYAYELITRMLLQTFPNTWCGFMRKWTMPLDGDSRSFYLQFADVIKIFKSRFSLRICGFEMDAEGKFDLSRDWFFNDYLEDHLNQTMTVDKLQGESMKVRYRDIVAFEKKEKSVLMYYREGKALQVVPIDYRFRELHNFLADLDFRPSTQKRESLIRTAVFARANGHWLINLQDTNWVIVNSRINYQGEIGPPSGQQVFLQNLFIPATNLPLVVATHSECKWAKKYLSEIFMRRK